MFKLIKDEKILVARNEANIKQSPIALFKRELPVHTSEKAHKKGRLAIAQAQMKQDARDMVEFIDWLDNGLRSSGSWRTEVRKIKQALKKLAEGKD